MKQFQQGSEAKLVSKYASQLLVKLEKTRKNHLKLKFFYQNEYLIIGDSNLRDAKEYLEQDLLLQEFG